jgi:hypothetical protein
MKSVRRFAWVGVALALGASGCGQDEENGPTSAADAGADAAAEAKAPDATPEAAADATSETVTDATSETAADAPLDTADAADAAAPAYGLFVTSNYTDKARLAVLDLDTRTAAGTTLDVPVQFGDVVPYASAKRGFLLDRTNGKVMVLDRTTPWTVAHSIDVKQDAAGLVNPHAAIVSTGAKTYVLRYGTNTIVVADANNGAVTGTIDLSSFLATGDPDGLVDAFDGVYDATTGRAYVLLQRIDQFAYNGKLDHLNPCFAFSPLVIAIDTATDQIVDLGGGDAGGKGIALLGQNPSALVADLAAGRLLVVESGCHDTIAEADGGVTEPRRLRGIESLTLATGASAWLYQYTDTDRLQGLVLSDATHAFVDVTDTLGADHWYAWDPTTAALGTAVAPFPSYPAHHGGKILGIGQAATTDGGKALSIVAYDVGSGQTQPLVVDAFHDTAKDMNAYGSAIIR